MSTIRKTAISQAHADRIEVRGYNIVALADEFSFGAMVYLLVQGEKPTPPVARLMDAMLVIMAEHSINAPSTHAARYGGELRQPAADGHGRRCQRHWRASRRSG